MNSNTDGVGTHLIIVALDVYRGVLYKTLPRRLQLPPLVLLPDPMGVAGQISEVRLVMPTDRMAAVAARMGRSEISRGIIASVEENHSDDHVYGGTVVRVIPTVRLGMHASKDVLVFIHTR